MSPWARPEDMGISRRDDGEAGWDGSTGNPGPTGWPSRALRRLMREIAPCARQSTGRACPWFAAGSGMPAHPVRHGDDSLAGEPSGQGSSLRMRPRNGMPDPLTYTLFPLSFDTHMPIETRYTNIYVQSLVNTPAALETPSRTHIKRSTSSTRARPVTSC